MARGPCRKCGASERNYRGDCMPCKRAYAKAWIQNNPEKRKARQQAWYKKSKDRIKEKARIWHENNPEKTKEAAARWRKRNPEKRKAIALRTAHKRRAAPGVLSKDIVEILMEKQASLCACCGASLAGGFHLDHIMPIALGGTNTDDNVQLLTPRCNLRKGMKHPDIYAQQKAVQTK